MTVRIFFFSLFLLSWVPLNFAEEVLVKVKSVNTIAHTDDNFVCATLDWWPSDKCNYGECPWIEAGILNLDLENPNLGKAIKAFNPLRVRVGGSLQDQVVYHVGKVKKCPHFKIKGDGLFGFSKGCLPMDRWNALHHLLSDNGALVTFGLNALYGRQQHPNKTEWTGPWDSSNARDFINYTISNAQKIDSWEFGNELSGSGIAASVNPTQYGQDLIDLKKVVTELYNSSSMPQPKILAPGGFFDRDWFIKLLESSGSGVVDVLTHHIYNLGAGNDPIVPNRMVDPFYLSEIAETYKSIQLTIQDFGPWSAAWVGEAGGAYNSGGPNVSNAFIDSFWYLDQLGMTSSYNHKAYCRQSLVGGNYGLLDTTTFVPNPDFYSALLWHRLMGKRVLGVEVDNEPYLRAYAHCAKNKAGVMLLFINLSNSTTFNVSMENDMNIFTTSSSDKVAKDVVSQTASKREEYHLTPKNGNIFSRVMLLNGSPLELTEAGEIPAISPLSIDSDSPILIAPRSIAFVRLPDFKAPACA
ncbi:hypothetical protein AMTRI_Chr10g225300 [Amborella trichopoda]